MRLKVAFLISAVVTEVAVKAGLLATFEALVPAQVLAVGIASVAAIAAEQLLCNSHDVDYITIRCLPS